MTTTMDFTVLHAQRVEQAERQVARRLLVDESRILRPHRLRTVLRTSMRAVARSLARRRVRSRRSRAAACAPRGTMAA